MLTAKDIMSKEVVSVTPDTSVEDAAKIMSKKGVSGLPVVSDGKLVGIVTEKDLIMKNKKLNTPDHINILGGIIFLENPRKFREEFKKFIAINVEDLMTEEVVTVNPDTPVDEIATIMVEKDVNRLPVIKNEKMVGIVARADLVKNMTGN